MFETTHDMNTLETIETLPKTKKTFLSHHLGLL